MPGLSRFGGTRRLLAAFCAAGPEQPDVLVIGAGICGICRLLQVMDEAGHDAACPVAPPGTAGRLLPGLAAGYVRRSVAEPAPARAAPGRGGCRRASARTAGCCAAAGAAGGRPGA